jgi:hypothetical protein
MARFRNTRTLGAFRRWWLALTDGARINAVARARAARVRARFTFGYAIEDEA